MTLSYGSVTISVASCYAIDERVNEFLLDRTGSFPVRKDFKLGFSKVAGLGVQAPQSHCLARRQSQDSADLQVRQIQFDQRLTVTNELVSRKRRERPLVRPRCPLMSTLAARMKNNIAEL